MSHTCHAFECSKAVKPEMFMCLSHWRRVPKETQRRIWALYRPGQCDDKNISIGYARTAKEAIVLVAKKEGKAVPKDHECLRLYDLCVGDSEDPSMVAQVIERLSSVER